MESSQIETLEIGMIFAVLPNTANEYACSLRQLIVDELIYQHNQHLMPPVNGWFFYPETVTDILSRFSSLSDFAIVIDNIS